MIFRRKSGVTIAALLVLLTALFIPMTAAAEPPPAPVTIQLLNVSDWHARDRPAKPKQGILSAARQQFRHCGNRTAKNIRIH